MRLGAAVGHALGHRIGLRPNNVLAQNPPIGLQGESHAPRDSDQVLPGQASRVAVAANATVAMHGLHMLATGAAAPLGVIRVAVGQIQPQHAVIGQQFAHAIKHFHQRGHVLGRRLLQANLSRVAVVSQPKVRRARHAALHAHAIGGERSHRVAAITEEDLVHAANPFSAR